MKPKVMRNWVILLPFLLFHALCCKAQVVGNVVDTAGHLISRAQLNAVEVETRAATSVVTDENGYFEFEGLNKGKYTISVSAPGFSDTVFEGIDVDTDVPNNAGTADDISSASWFQVVLKKEK